MHDDVTNENAVDHRDSAMAEEQKWKGDGADASSDHQFYLLLFFLADLEVIVHLRRWLQPRLGRSSVMLGGSKHLKQQSMSLNRSTVLMLFYASY